MVGRLVWLGGGGLAGQRVRGMWAAWRGEDRERVIVWSEREREREPTLQKIRHAGRRKLMNH
jgi:hypothetical protein